MEKKYRMDMLYICTFIHLKGINITPDLKYPSRLCVIDEEKNFAIDIKTKLKYDYLETFSRLYINAMIEKTKNGRRVAIPAGVCMIPDNENIINEGNEIIKQLKKGVEFEDGNKILNNEQYIDYIVEEMEREKIEQSQTKKLGKRRK